ncbi:hypothetical protein GGR51DRAFT_558826 [Nemania sp. FL0031]|nr:hypothetical protein GGR51DRAFT_558826 [Nemania sp. FL0031]
MLAEPPDHPPLTYADDLPRPDIAERDSDAPKFKWATLHNEARDMIKDQAAPTILSIDQNRNHEAPFYFTNWTRHLLSKLSEGHEGLASFQTFFNELASARREILETKCWYSVVWKGYASQPPGTTENANIREGTWRRRPLKLFFIKWSAGYHSEIETITQVISRRGRGNDSEPQPAKATSNFKPQGLVKQFTQPSIGKELVRDKSNGREDAKATWHQRHVLLPFDLRDLSNDIHRGEVSDLLYHIFPKTTNVTKVRWHSLESILTDKLKSAVGQKFRLQRLGLEDKGEEKRSGAIEMRNYEYKCIFYYLRERYSKI